MSTEEEVSGVLNCPSSVEEGEDEVVASSSISSSPQGKQHLLAFTVESIFLKDLYNYI